MSHEKRSILEDKGYREAIAKLGGGKPLGILDEPGLRPATAAYGPGARRHRGRTRDALLERAPSLPYAVYFVLRDEERISVIAVLHQKRNPATWKRRFAREGKAG